MDKISVGQRWISESELELGLGIIKDIDQRLVTLFFPATGDERIYARANAPIARISFAVNDLIHDNKGVELEVQGLEEIDGLIMYQCLVTSSGEPVLIPEVKLSFHVSLNKPVDRLLKGQIDHPKSFHLRYAALRARDTIYKAGTTGFLGPRTDLIPHQISIAAEVGSRFAPRVLLADEVGLGKTIEAGMIIHQQILTERAQRILIIVPDVLIHQWFVEMLRRFNLHFSIFDQERLENISEENPFETEQLILCGYDLLDSDNGYLLQEAQWDIVVADEAHHIEYDHNAISDSYRKFEQLALQSKGLLLLTATPEQLGVESHFARLQLLDHERYYDLQAFVDEQKQYQPIADLSLKLLDGIELAEHDKDEIKRLTGLAVEPDNHHDLVQKLLDRNGTGRVFFRNTRSNVPGFKKRILNPVPLENTTVDFQTLIAKHVDYASVIAATTEINEQDIAPDSRTKWITRYLKQNSDQKILIICSKKDTAINLEIHLRYKEGLSTSVFHEDMDLIARDRAAAYFSDEDGAQCMICSEIGSEGRNFQFSSHLILFDLPEHPDLLEQRIGRLDRIGQQNDINIYPLYFKDTPQEVMFRWYQDGMGAFVQCNPVGSLIFKATADELHQCLLNYENKSSVNAFIDKTAIQSQQYRTSLETGRDRLVAINSFNEELASRYIDNIKKLDHMDLQEFMEKVFDQFGINYEEQSDGSTVITPGDDMAFTSFPGLPDDGITATFSRELALSRDDLHFLTWEHPIVRDTIDLILQQETGTACVSLLKSKNIPEGTVLLELIFDIQCSAPGYLMANKFIQNTSFRLLLDKNGKNLSESIQYDSLKKLCRPLDRAKAQKIASMLKDEIEKVLDISSEQIEPVIKQNKILAIQLASNNYREEITRLEELSKINPSIKPVEISLMKERQALLVECLDGLEAQLESANLIITARS